MILEISKESQKVINSFLNLEFGKKKVITPYYMNIKKQKAGLRVMVGKGTADEIVLETKVWAQVKGFNLKKANNQEIRDFMTKMGIGIDCSGFATYVLNAQLKSLNLKPVWNYLNFEKNSLLYKLKRKLRPVENIGANLLTNEQNCIKIENLDNIKPGDLIRAKGKQKNAHHVAIITKVEKNSQNKTLEFEYAHSHRFYEHENGIRIGKVKILNSSKGLKDQKFYDHINDRNYFMEDLLVDYEDNGIRRLKILEK